jgi:hypothetical protein
MWGTGISSAIWEGEYFLKTVEWHRRYCAYNDFKGSRINRSPLFFRIVYETELYTWFILHAET